MQIPGKADRFGRIRISPPTLHIQVELIQDLFQAKYWLLQKNHLPDFAPTGRQPK